MQLKKNKKHISPDPQRNVSYKTFGYFLFLFFLLPALTAGQDSIRILKNELSKSPAKKRYKIFLSLAKHETDSAESISYIQKAIASAEKNNTKNTLAEAYLEATKINFNKGYYSTALEYSKKALDIARSVNSADMIAEAYNYSGWIYSRQHKNDKALKNFLQAISYYEKSGSIEKTGNVYNSIAATYFRRNDYVKALEFFERALQIGTDYNNVTLQIKANNNIGIVYETLSQYDKALECQLKALELAQKTNAAKQRASTYVNIGNIYFYLNQFGEATNSYLKALDIYSKINDDTGQSVCHNNLGECYLKQNHISKAISHYQKALRYAMTNKDTLKISTILLNIGNANRLAGDLDKAYSTLNKALDMCDVHSDLGIKAETLLYLGETVSAQNKPNKALNYFTRARELATRINDKQLLLKIYDSLAKFYYAQKKYKDAYLYRDKYAILNDTINSDNMIENMAKMNAAYQSFKDQATILNLQKENISHSKELLQEKNKKILFFIASISFLIIIIVLLTLFLYRRKTANELKQKNEALNNLNATKDKFFSIIAHDLKSPFNSLLGFSEMLSLHAETKNIDQVIEYSNIIHNSTKKLFNLVENLLQWSRAQLGTTKYSPEQTDIYMLANNIISLLRLNAEEKDVVISSKMTKNLIGWVDVDLFNTVLRNLLSNAIKFSRVGSMIQVTGIREGDEIKISVSDTGVGIRKDNLEKLFDAGTNITTKGTFNEKGTGLGLILCKEFVEINKGNIWVESEYGHGSTFYFTVPVYDENKHKTK